MAWEVGVAEAGWSWFEPRTFCRKRKGGLVTVRQPLPVLLDDPSQVRGHVDGRRAEIKQISVAPSFLALLRVLVACELWGNHLPVACPASFAGDAHSLALPNSPPRSKGKPCCHDGVFPQCIPEAYNALATVSSGVFQRGVIQKQEKWQLMAKFRRLCIWTL